MIVLDVKLLIYAHDSRSPHHPAARRWLESTISGTELVRIPLVALLAFLRIVTNPRIYPSPLAPSDGLALIGQWLAHPHVAIALPSERHWQVFRDLLDRGQARGSLVRDAHIAALAVEHGATLMTMDRGFARFPGLRFRNPLAA